MGNFLQHFEEKNFVQINESLNPITHFKNFLNKDWFINDPVHEINHRTFSVRKVDASNVHKLRVNTNFEPTHILHINGTHYIVGRELGLEGHQVYRINHTKDSTGKNTITHTNVSGFKLLHEHPELTRTHIGRDIYNEHKEEFRQLPLTASASQIQRVMGLNPVEKTGSTLNSTLMGIAAKHHNTTSKAIDAALRSQYKDKIGNMMYKRLITMHGLTREQATIIKNMPHLMGHPQIAATVTNRLSRP